MLMPYDDSYDEIPASHSNKLIMVVGKCQLDCIHNCEQYPGEATDKRCIDGRLQRGGSASNICTVLRHLGAKCEFLGMLSNSRGFEFLQADCRQRKINIDNCPLINRIPPISTYIRSNKTGSRTIIHSNVNFPIFAYEHFRYVPLYTINMGPDDTRKPFYHWIHFEGCNPDETYKMIDDIFQMNSDLPDEEKIKISVELEKQNVDLLPLAEMSDYVFIGKNFAQYLGFENAKDTVYGVFEMLQNKKESRSESEMSTISYSTEYCKPIVGYDKCVPNIICAWGAEGTSCLELGKNYAQVTSFQPSIVIDPMGASETFCAAAIYALSISKTNLVSAVEFGNRVAGFKLKCDGFEKLKLFRQQ